MERASKANCRSRSYSETVNRKGAQNSQIALTLPFTSEGSLSAFNVGRLNLSTHDRGSLQAP